MATLETILRTWGQRELTVALTPGRLFPWTDDVLPRGKDRSPGEVYALFPHIRSVTRVDGRRFRIRSWELDGERARERRQSGSVTRLARADFTCVGESRDGR